MLYKQLLVGFILLPLGKQRIDPGVVQCKFPDHSSLHPMHALNIGISIQSQASGPCSPVPCHQTLTDAAEEP